MDESKEYTLRELTADDIFPMCAIISKLGIKEIKNTFDPETIRTFIKNTSEPVDVETVGVSIAFDIADVLLANLPKCKDQLYVLLSQLSGLTKDEIGKLPMATFAQMILDVINSKGFPDFFQVVSKYIK